MIIRLSFILIALLKLIITTLICFILGIEREFHSHPGGITTHILVGVGSCIFTMISVDYNKIIENKGDPMRIAAQIVSGMGFLGSATIYKSKEYVKGINTAASLWIAAANGMAVGSDMIEYGIVCSIITLLILIINKYYKKHIYNNRIKNNKKNDIELEKENIEEQIYIEDEDE